MRCSQSGPIIQVKEEYEIAFHNPKCCGGLITNKLGVLYPDYRCRDHNKQYCKHKRIKRVRKKFKKIFDKKRHKFIKMLTFGLPGKKTTSMNIIDNKVVEPFIRRNKSKLQFLQEVEEVTEYEIDHKKWREELRSKFNNLRRDKWWKAHVDGGVWFYETTIREIENEEEVQNVNDIQMKIHPHFHCMIIGPRNLGGPERNFQELNDLFEKHGLGKPHVQVPRSKDGRPLNASLNKSLWYLTNYLKKDDHAEGINRGSFGEFNKKSK